MPGASNSRLTMMMIAVMARTIEDIEKALLRAMNDAEGQEKLRRFARQVRSGEMTCFYMENIECKRLAKELDDRKVPYMLYAGRSGSKDMLFVPSEYADLAVQIDKNVRIYAGLEIDQKSELDRAIYEMEKPGNRKEYVIRGLNEYEATRIVQMASRSHPKFVAVAEKQEDGTYLVASHQKRAKAMNSFAMTAMLESANTHPVMKNVKENTVFWNTQKEMFRSAVDDMRSGTCQEAYLFSTKDPGKYMHISQKGYEMVQDGKVTNRDSINGNIGNGMSWDPANYADRAWLFGSSLEDYVYVKAEDVQSRGGANAFIHNVLPNYPGRLNPNMLKGEREFARVANEYLDAKNGMYWGGPYGMPMSVDMDELMARYKDAIMANSSMNQEDKERALKNMPAFQKAMDETLKKAASPATSARAEDVKVSGETVISAAYNKLGLSDMAREESFYDKKEVNKIVNGDYIDSGNDAQSDGMQTADGRRQTADSRNAYRQGADRQVGEEMEGAR